MRRRSRWSRHLQEVAELLDGQAGIPDDTAHRYGVDRIMARDGQNPGPIPHYNVFALSQDGESGLLQRADGIKVIDAGKLGQG